MGSRAGKWKNTEEALKMDDVSLREQSPVAEVGSGMASEWIEEGATPEQWQIWLRTRALHFDDTISLMLGLQRTGQLDRSIAQFDRMPIEFQDDADMMRWRHYQELLASAIRLVSEIPSVPLKSSWDDFGKDATMLASLRACQPQITDPATRSAIIRQLVFSILVRRGSFRKRRWVASRHIKFSRAIQAKPNHHEVLSLELRPIVRYVVKQSSCPHLPHPRMLAFDVAEAIAIIEAGFSTLKRNRWRGPAMSWTIWNQSQSALPPDLDVSRTALGSATAFVVRLPWQYHMTALLRSHSELIPD